MESRILGKQNFWSIWEEIEIRTHLVQIKQGRRTFTPVMIHLLHYDSFLTKRNFRKLIGYQLQIPSVQQGFWVANVLKQMWNLKKDLGILTGYFFKISSIEGISLSVARTFLLIVFISYFLQTYYCKSCSSLISSKGSILTLVPIFISK